ncbi:MAG: type VII toxin-antitoxin system HepT family RNase toxin [Methylococcales bacterium]
MDRSLIEQKLESLRRALHRVAEKCPMDADVLANDYDTQDIVALNLTRAVQLCVDIGAHLIADNEFPPPDTMGQVFDILNKAGFIDSGLAIRMKKAVGFRNLAVHNYETINWAIVHAIARYGLVDFAEFAQAVVKVLNNNT